MQSSWQIILCRNSNSAFREIVSQESKADEQTATTILVLGWSSTAFALLSVRALVFDEYSKLYVTAARARGVSGRKLLWRYPARHALGPIVNSLGFDLNRVFNELPIVAFILAITDTGALLLQALVYSHDEQLAAAIIFLLAASVITLNFITDILLAMLDPRFGRSLMG